MHSKKLKSFFSFLLQTIFISSAVIFSVIPVSCNATTEGIQILGGDYTSANLEKLEVLDENRIRADFSKQVQILGAVVSPVLEGISDSSESSITAELSDSLKAACGEYSKISVEASMENENKSIIFNLKSPCIPGKNYELYGQIQDLSGNTVTFCAGFTGYNSRIPELLITEVQRKHEKKSYASGEEYYKSEYVEFIARNDGNLAGLELVVASLGEDKAFDFPAVEVKGGEVFVFHLRNDGEGCVSEEESLEENPFVLTAASAQFSSEVRDLWTSSTSAVLNDENDILFIRNKSTKKIYDCVLYSKQNLTEWKSGVQPYAQLLYENGLCSSADYSAAAVYLKTTTGGSLHRKNRESVLKAQSYPVCFNKEDWKEGDTSPGI